MFIFFKWPCITMHEMIAGSILTGNEQWSLALYRLPAPTGSKRTDGQTDGQTDKGIRKTNKDR